MPEGDGGIVFYFKQGEINLLFFNSEDVMLIFSPALSVGCLLVASRSLSHGPGVILLS